MAFIRRFIQAIHSSLLTGNSFIQDRASARAKPLLNVKSQEMNRWAIKGRREVQFLNYSKRKKRKGSN
jgi:hypothetical protein